VVTAPDKGEDMAASIKEMSRNIMNKTISKAEPTKEKVEETALE
jgi:hypothetical protein